MFFLDFSSTIFSKMILKDFLLRFCLDFCPKGTEIRCDLSHRV